MKKKGLKYKVFKSLKESNIDVRNLTNKQVYNEYLVHKFGMSNKDTVKRAVSEYRAYLSEKPIETLFSPTKPVKKDKGHKILFIPDLHAPFIHKDALKFCVELREKHQPDEIVFAGDIIDNHYSSFHDQDPDGMSANEEMNKGRAQLRAWKEEFPIAKVMIGNHDAIPNRKAFNAGLSSKWIRTIDEVYNLEGWDFVQNYTVGRNFFTHGMGQNAVAKARALNLNVFAGHLHSKFFCQLVSTFPEPTFAVQAGCLIDHKAYAFAYGKDGAPCVKGAVVIEDALVNPVITMVPMPTYDK